MIITIDGPTAGGKSTTGRELAKQLKIYYLNSGLMYRAVAYLLVNKMVYKRDDLAHPHPNDVNAILDPRRFVYEFDDRFQARIMFDDIDITPLLKNGFMDQAASLVSTDAYVREQLNMIQRTISQTYSLVADGRDCGTIVFPEATFKIYLTADIQERARRWQHDQEKFGITMSVQEATNTITERDKRDAERKNAPLVIPDGAMVVDNTGLTVGQTIDKILTYISHDKQIRMI